MLHRKMQQRALLNQGIEVFFIAVYIHCPGISPVLALTITSLLSVMVPTRQIGFRRFEGMPTLAAAGHRYRDSVLQEPGNHHEIEVARTRQQVASASNLVFPSSSCRYNLVNHSMRDNWVYRAAFHAAEVPAASSNTQETDCL